MVVGQTIEAMVKAVVMAVALIVELDLALVAV
jgi:hypothetical protein